MKKLIGSILCFMVTVTLQAQLEPLSSQYLLNTLAINPAYAGSREALSVVALHRNQWTGFKGAPKTASLAMHAPLRNEKIGLGVLAVNDQRGITSSNIVTGNFAYRIIADKGVLSLGLAGGFTFVKNDWNSLVAVDPDDALLTGNSRGYLLPDFSLGAYFNSEKLFFGISVPMFIAHDFDPSSNTFRLANNYEEYNFFFNGGYLLNLSSTTRLLPSLLVRFNRASNPQTDLNMHLVLYDRIRTGLSYRSNKSIVGLLMYQVNSQLALAYSYDMGFGNLGGTLGGSHEIMIRYDFLYLIDVIHPRYF